MTKIKFGTDGWRAIIALEYTVDNVIRVTEGAAKWMRKNKYTKVVVGHDCRFGGPMFAETTTRAFGAYGIKVLLAKDYVSTPMVSLGVLKTESDLGIVITASHNPPSYNGYKLKSAYGGPTIPVHIAEVEDQIPNKPKSDLPTIEEMEENGLLEYIDLEGMYIDHVKANFDLEAIRNSGIKLAYDAMYGAGKRAMMRLLPDSVFIHCDDNPSFKGQAPEPIHRNLQELSDLIKNDKTIDCGLANDGDADRIGMYDADGNFVDSHHLLLILLLYMTQHKKQTGKVVVSCSVTNKLRQMADLYGLEFIQTKIGFKHIAEIMTTTEVVVGGEESGGITVNGHIPERDGIWMGMLILEFMAKTGKSLKALIKDVYKIVGAFSFNRDDLHIKESQKQAIVKQCKTNPYKAFGKYKVHRLETIDGFKFFLSADENEWVMIRPSGTEPVLRVYAQAPNAKGVRSILDATKETILN